MEELVVRMCRVGGYTVFFELFMARRSGCSDIQGLSFLEKLGVDGAGVVVAEDEDVLVIT